MIPRLKEKYRTVAAAALREQFAYRNVNQIPRLTKIVVNMGVGDALQDSKRLEGAVADLTAITGQKPVVRRAHKAIANFKLVVDNCPSDEAALYRLGMCIFKSNKIPEAIQVFKQAVKLDPNDSRAAQMLEMLTQVPGV